MIPYLSSRGANIFYYDPTGKKKEFDRIKKCIFNSDIAQCCLNADLVILHTEWDEFKSLDFKKLVNKTNFKIYDLRNLFSFNEMRIKKMKYYSVGRPDII
jgi:UDPglucose 6-dehydrogenase